MTTLTKILLGALAVVLLLFVGLIVTVTMVFEPNDYRPYLVRAVESTTGRDFALDGDLDLKLFPCCGVSIGSASLGNPEGFPPEPFASIESAAVSVQVWPLIMRREVQIGTVTLDGLSVRLLELPDGSANWTFEAGDSPEDEPVTAEGEAAIRSLSIEGLQIRNGTITFADRSGAAYTASDIQLETGAVDGEKPVPVALKLTAQDESDGSRAVLQLAASLSLAESSVRLEAPRLAVDAAGAAVPTGEARAEIAATVLEFDTGTGNGNAAGVDGEVLLPGLRIQIAGDAAFENDVVTGSGSFTLGDGDLRKLLAALPDFDYEPADADAFARLAGSGRWTLTETGAGLSNLHIELDDSTVTGDLAITNFESGAAALDLELDRLDVDAYLPREEAVPAAPAAEPTVVPFDSLRELALDARLRIRELSASGLDVAALELTLDSNGDTMTLVADAEISGGRVRLSGSGSPADPTPSLAGRLALEALSPRALLTALGEPLDTADPAALTRLAGQTAWRLGSRSLKLTDMSWQLDATQLTGALGIDDFDQPDVRFELALDRIDLDRYLAPETENAEPGDGEELEIPTEMIRDLKVDGRLTAGTLSIMKMQLENLEARVNAAGGVLRLEPLRAELYGGTYRGSIAIDATGPKSKLTLDQGFDAVQIGAMLDSLIGSERMAGALTLSLQGTGVGNTQTELLKGLAGDFAFSLSEGAYRGMDIAWEIQNAQALLNRAAPPDRPNRKETPIRTLSFAGRMVDGVLGSDSLTAEIPYLKLGGKGGVNLLERTLDYELKAQLLKSAENDPALHFQGLAGRMIPLTIKGPMSQPKVAVDLKGLIGETIKERARDALFDRLGIGPETPPPAPGSIEAVPEGPPDEARADPDASSSAAALEQEETDEEPPPAEAERNPDETTPEDLLRRSLRDLLKRPGDPS